MNLEARTHEYDTILEEQIKISSTSSLYVTTTVILGIILSIIFIIIDINTSLKTVLIIFCILFTITTPIFIRSYFVRKFETNTSKIIQIYKKEYNITEHDLTIGYINSNCNLDENFIKKPKDFLCVLKDDYLRFVSKDFLLINEVFSYNSQYEDYINTDFGKITIPIKQIDFYIQKYDQFCTLVLKDNDNEKIIKINFNSDNAFEHFIPKLEYYFNTVKKSNLN